MMKKEKNQKKEINKKQKAYDKGQIFVKVMAGVLALMMLSGTVITIVFALMG